MAEKRILLVDDDILVLSSLDTLLKSNGYATVTASSGSKAIGVLRHASFAVVLMDVVMRGFDGVDALREIKKHFPEVPVILISGYSEPERILEALSAGAEDYIIKPCEEEEIIARIEDVFRRRDERNGSTLEAL